MTSLLFQKFQPNNKRGISKTCGVCKKQFGLFNRGQHQCKRCIRPICEDCGKTKKDVYKIGMIKNPHRVCSICAKQSDFIHMFIEINKLKYGEDSLISKKWLNKTPKQPRQSFIRAVSHKQLQRFNFEVFSRMWDSYNFSLRQFIGLLTFNKNQNDVYKLVRQTYDELLDKGIDQKIQNIMYVIVLVLAFSSPSSCAKIIQKLLKLKTYILDGKSILQSYFRFLKIDQSQLKKINQYMNYKFKNFMGAFSVNILTTQCSIHLLTQALEWQKIQQFYLFFAIVIQDNFQYLLNNMDSKIDCDVNIVRNCQLYRYIQKSKAASIVKIDQYIRKQKQQEQTQGKHIEHSPVFKTMPNNSDLLNEYSISSNMLHSHDYDQQDQSRRKTQKHTTRLPKTTNMQELQSSVLNVMDHEQSCYQCLKKKDRIQMLEKKLKEKQRQVQNLNFKLTFRRQTNLNNGAMSNFRHGSDHQQHQDNQSNFNQVNNDNFNKQIQRYKKQNQLLKLKIQQLEQQNKILKSNYQSSSQSSSSPQKNTSPTQKSQDQTKIVQVLKKTLDSKNKQLQETMKKNKLLNYQIQEMQKQYSIKKPESISGTKDELMKKIQQLTKQVNSQQDEKIRLSQELFELKQQIKQMNFSVDMAPNSGSQQQSSPGPKGKQCTIF